MNHRRVRHHEQEIEEVRQLFGEIAAEIARMHVELDLLEDGWNYGDPFPTCENEYVALHLA